MMKAGFGQVGSSKLEKQGKGRELVLGLEQGGSGTPQDETMEQGSPSHKFRGSMYQSVCVWCSKFGGSKDIC